jgi:hypothetical protein
MDAVKAIVKLWNFQIYLLITSMNDMKERFSESLNFYKAPTSSPVLIVTILKLCTLKCVYQIHLFIYFFHHLDWLILVTEMHYVWRQKDMLVLFTQACHFRMARHTETCLNSNLHMLKSVHDQSLVDFKSNFWAVIQNITLAHLQFLPLSCVYFWLNNIFWMFSSRRDGVNMFKSVLLQREKKQTLHVGQIFLNEPLAMLLKSNGAKSPWNIWQGACPPGTW